MTRVVVDSSSGSDPLFAALLAEALRERGFEVEVREPALGRVHDTFVHNVTEGVAVRVMDDASPDVLALVAASVRSAEGHRTSTRRRYRDVPVYDRETRRALAWVDVFGG